MGNPLPEFSASVEKIAGDRVYPIKIKMAYYFNRHEQNLFSGGVLHHGR